MIQESGFVSRMTRVIGMMLFDVGKKVRKEHDMGGMRYKKRESVCVKVKKDNGVGLLAEDFLNIEIVPAELTTNIFNRLLLGLRYKDDDEKSNYKGNTHKDQKDIFMHGTFEE